MLHLYNTLTKRTEAIQPIDGTTIRLYTCGPTVYNYVHIGNLRSYIMADILYRTLIFDGYSVEYVMNITDVDDKTIKGTIAKFGTNATVEDLHTFTTEFYDAFLEDLAAVNVDASTIKMIRVSEVIPQIQEFILKLIEKGYAYHADDGVYFSIEKYQQDFKDYGSLVGQKFLEGKKIGARVAVDEYDKENLSDFALWKAHTDDDANIFWDHPVLGKGRPGWHIECSVINRVGFGEHPIDIHTGGVDLIFPHHTNEIAQSQPLGPFVKQWMHAEHLMVQNDKMAKSKQNFFTLRDIEAKGFSGLDLRYLYLQSHYKTQANFSWESLEAAQTALRKLQVTAENSNSSESQVNNAFRESLSDDLNTAKALAVTWENKSEIGIYRSILGLQADKQNVIDNTDQQQIPEEVHTLLKDRQEARDAKDFVKSDELRQQISDYGFEIFDTNNGQQIKRK